MVSWQTNNVIKSSGGLSGFPLNHSDAGGYCTVDVPLIRYRRSEELLLRWMEANAFTVVFRTHEEAAEKGLPVARHLFLHYPEDRRVQGLTYQQFLVRTEMLVVPVLDKGRSSVTAYFPVAPDGGSWRHVWTGEEFGGGYSGTGEEERTTVRGVEAEVKAPVGYPAVFVRVPSLVTNDMDKEWTSK